MPMQWIILNITRVLRAVIAAPCCIIFPVLFVALVISRAAHPARFCSARPPLAFPLVGAFVHVVCIIRPADNAAAKEIYHSMIKCKNIHSHLMKLKCTRGEKWARVGDARGPRAADSAGKRKLPVGSAQLDGFHPWGGEPSFSSLGQRCECQPAIAREREGYLSISPAPNGKCQILFFPLRGRRAPPRLTPTISRHA